MPIKNKTILWIEKCSKQIFYWKNTEAKQESKQRDDIKESEKFLRFFIVHQTHFTEQFFNIFEAYFSCPGFYYKNNHRFWGVNWYLRPTEEASYNLTRILVEKNSLLP